MATARALGRRVARRADVAAVAREQASIVEDALGRHETRWGWNAVEVDLPTVFALQGLGRADAQRVVYAAIVRDLEARGFEARLCFGAGADPEGCRLLVGWYAGITAGEAAAIDQRLARALLPPAELAAFRGGTHRAAAPRRA